MVNAGIGTRWISEEGQADYLLDQNADTRRSTDAIETRTVAITKGTATKYRLPMSRKSVTGNKIVDIADVRTTTNAHRSPATAEDAA